MEGENVARQKCLKGEKVEHLCEACGLGTIGKMGKDKGAEASISACVGIYEKCRERGVWENRRGGGYITQIIAFLG